MEDFNSKVRTGIDDRTTVGRYGLRVRNQRGDWIVQFCVEQKLIIEKRFLWFHPRGVYIWKLHFFVLWPHIGCAQISDGTVGVVEWNTGTRKGDGTMERKLTDTHWLETSYWISTALSRFVGCYPLRQGNNPLPLSHWSDSSIFTLILLKNIICPCVLNLGLQSHRPCVWALD